MEFAFEIFEVNGGGLSYRFAESEIGLVGKAHKDLVRGDVLIKNSKTKLEILKIYTHRQEATAVPAGTPCILVVSQSDKELIFYHEAQKLAGQLLYIENDGEIK